VTCLRYPRWLILAACVLTRGVLRYPKGCATPGEVPCQCDTRGPLSKLERAPPQRKIDVTSKSPVGDISVVTLIRTDTTLDHSQKAEKVWSGVGIALRAARCCCTPAASTRRPCNWQCAQRSVPHSRLTCRCLICRPCSPRSVCARQSLVEARKLSTTREILLWMTPSEAPKALQASECSELLDPMRASCWISAQH